MAEDEGENRSLESAVPEKGKPIEVAPEEGKEILSDAEPGEVPVLPVRGLVVFPGTMVPLTIGRPTNLRLLEETLPQSKTVALMTQLHAEEEAPQPDGLYPVGVIGEVARMIRQDENTGVVLVGIHSLSNRDRSA